MTLYSSHANSLHKASILFRGDALGVTWQAEQKEKYTERSVAPAAAPAVAAAAAVLCCCCH